MKLSFFIQEDKLLYPLSGPPSVSVPTLEKGGWVEVAVQGPAAGITVCLLCAGAILGTCACHFTPAALIVLLSHLPGGDGGAEGHSMCPGPPAANRGPERSRTQAQVVCVCGGQPLAQTLPLALPRVGVISPPSLVSSFESSQSTHLTFDGDNGVSMADGDKPPGHSTVCVCVLWGVVVN